MNAPAEITAALEQLPTFAEVNRQTCLVCMGRRYVPVTVRDRFTGRLVTHRCMCLRCNGTGRVDSN